MFVAGIVYFADDTGRCSEVIHVNAPLNTLYYSPTKVLPLEQQHELIFRVRQDYLLIVTEDVVLYKFKFSADGKMAQEKKVYTRKSRCPAYLGALQVKLSIKGDGKELQCVFAGNNSPSLH